MICSESLNEREVLKSGMSAEAHEESEFYRGFEKSSYIRAWYELVYGIIDHTRVHSEIIRVCEEQLGFEYPGYIIREDAQRIRDITKVQVGGLDHYSISSSVLTNPRRL